MAIESYENYLRLLKLPRHAPEEDIRAAILNEQRIWTRRTNSPKLEQRQEAEKMIAILQDAEKILLGPEGQTIRSMLRNQATTGSEPESDLVVDPDTVARAIEKFVSIRGRKSQERKGTVLYKRGTIFYKGIDYFVEELVHKQYQASQDMKQCNAFQGGLKLFEWYCMVSGNTNQGNTKTFIRGPWIKHLMTISVELESG